MSSFMKQLKNNLSFKRKKEKPPQQNHAHLNENQSNLYMESAQNIDQILTTNRDLLNTETALKKDPSPPKKLAKSEKLRVKKTPDVFLSTNNDPYRKNSSDESSKKRKKHPKKKESPPQKKNSQREFPLDDSSSKTKSKRKNKNKYQSLQNATGDIYNPLENEPSVENSQSSIKQSSSNKIPSENYKKRSDELQQQNQQQTIPKSSPKDEKEITSPTSNSDLQINEINFSQIGQQSCGLNRKSQFYSLKKEQSKTNNFPTKPQENNNCQDTSQVSEFNEDHIRETVFQDISMKNNQQSDMNINLQTENDIFCLSNSKPKNQNYCKKCEKNVFATSLSGQSKYLVCNVCHKNKIHQHCLKAEQNSKTKLQSIKSLLMSQIKENNLSWRCSDCKDQGCDQWKVVCRIFNVNRKWFFYRLRVLIVKTQFKQLSKPQIKQMKKLLKDKTICSFDKTEHISILDKYLNWVPILSPYSYIYTFWSFILFSAIAYKIFEVPLITSFNIEDISNDLYQIPLMGIFLLEILLCLNTGFFEEGLVVLNRKRIQSHYIYGKFKWDILTLLSFFLSFVFDSSYFALPFLLRIQQVQNILETIEYKLQMANKKKEIVFSILTIVKLITMVFFVAHYLGCGFHYTSYRVQEDAPGTDTWITSNGFSENSTFERYIFALYFAFISMSTIGYGDITPQNVQEKLYIIVSTLISCGVFAYSLNVITSIFSDFDQKSAQFRQEKSEILMYMKQRNITNDLQIKIIKNLEHKNQMELSGVSRSQEILNGLSTALVKQIKKEFFLGILKNQNVFKANFTEPFLNDLSQEMEEQNIASDELIFKEQDLPNKLYFIFKGGVSIMKSHNLTKKQSLEENMKISDVVIQNLKQGELVDLKNFFIQRPRQNPAISKNLTQLITLSWESLQEVLKKHPQDHERFQQVQDQLKIEPNHQLNYRYTYCNFCQQYGHTVVLCPYLHVYIDKMWMYKTRAILDSKDEKQERRSLPFAFISEQTSQIIQIKRDLKHLTSNNNNSQNRKKMYNRRQSKIPTFFNRFTQEHTKEETRVNAFFIRKKYVLEHIFHLDNHFEDQEENTMFPLDFFPSISRYISSQFTENMSDEQFFITLPGIIIDQDLEMLKQENEYNQQIMQECEKAQENIPSDENTSNNNSAISSNQGFQGTRAQSKKMTYHKLGTIKSIAQIYLHRSKKSNRRTSNESQNQSNVQSNLPSQPPSMNLLQSQSQNINNNVSELQNNNKEKEENIIDVISNDFKIIGNFDYNFQKDAKNKLIMQYVDLYEQAKQYEMYKEHHITSDSNDEEEEEYEDEEDQQYEEDYDHDEDQEQQFKIASETTPQNKRKKINQDYSRQPSSNNNNNNNNNNNKENSIILEQYTNDISGSRSRQTTPPPNIQPTIHIDAIQESTSKNQSNIQRPESNSSKQVGLLDFSQKYSDTSESETEANSKKQSVVEPKKNTSSQLKKTPKASILLKKLSSQYSDKEKDKEKEQDRGKTLANININFSPSPKNKNKKKGEKLKKILSKKKPKASLNPQNLTNINKLLFGNSINLNKELMKDDPNLNLIKKRESQMNYYSDDRLFSNQLSVQQHQHHQPSIKLSALQSINPTYQATSTSNSDPQNQQFRLGQIIENQLNNKDHSLQNNRKSFHINPQSFQQLSQIPNNNNHNNSGGGGLQSSHMDKRDELSSLKLMEEDQQVSNEQLLLDFDQAKAYYKYFNQDNYQRVIERYEYWRKQTLLKPHKKTHHNKHQLKRHLTKSLNKQNYKGPKMERSRKKSHLTKEQMDKMKVVMKQSPPNSGEKEKTKKGSALFKVFKR